MIKCFAEPCLDLEHKQLDPGVQHQQQQDLEWKDLVTNMTRTLMTGFGVKERTARGYAIVIAALRFIYSRNEEYFLNRNHPWSEFMEVCVIL